MNLAKDERILKKYFAFEGLGKVNTQCDVTVTNKRLNITTIGSYGGTKTVDIGDYAIDNISAITSRMAKSLNIALLIFGILLLLASIGMFVAQQTRMFGFIFLIPGIIFIIMTFLFPKKYGKITIMGKGFEPVTYVGSNVKSRKAVALGMVKPGPDFELMQNELMAVVLAAKTGNTTSTASNIDTPIIEEE